MSSLNSCFYPFVYLTQMGCGFGIGDIHAPTVLLYIVLHFEEGIYNQESKGWWISTYG